METVSVAILFAMDALLLCQLNFVKDAIRPNAIVVHTAHGMGDIVA